MGYQRRVHGIPQISPINWFFLFIFFNLGFYLLLVKNFYLINKIFNNEKILKDFKKKSYYFEL